jgi:hypothetical protein
MFHPWWVEAGDLGADAPIRTMITIMIMILPEEEEEQGNPLRREGEEEQ